LPSASKSNAIVPAGSGIETGFGADETGFALFAPKPKKTATDEAKAETGETGFAISNPSGSCGAVKKSRIDSFADFTEDTKLTKMFESFSGKRKGCGGAETGTADGKDEFPFCAELIQIGLNKITGAKSAIISISAISLGDANGRTNRLKNSKIKSEVKVALLAALFLIVWFFLYI
jgi:hypothetical protein